MISIEAYRMCIGKFAFTAQQSLKSITKSVTIGSVFTNNGLSRLLKPAPFIALFVFLTFAFPKSYQKILDTKSRHSSLTFHHFYRNGLFLPYPAMENVSDQSLIFINVNYTLLLSGDVELNPGPIIPPQPNKCVQGSFNQGDIARFGYTAGFQCSCNTLVSIIFAKCKQINVWKA